MKMKSNLFASAACGLAGLLAWTACTSEYEHPIDKGIDGGTGDPTRREVLLTLKNNLSVSPSTTKAGEIATDDENFIETLDVYVFGSEEENGVYTFQERFAYRPDGLPIPAGATPLELTAIPGKSNNTTAKLTPKKGLYVRLYCIANQKELKDPDKLRDTTDPANPTTPLVFADPNQTVADSLFVSLVMTATGENGSSVMISRPGSPTEQEFLTYRTPFIDPASAVDTLASPLPMSGALTVPIDLTDLAISSHINTGIRLTRMVARFDIVNKTEQSNFRITSVSMGNGRKAATFFPIKPCGNQPAAASDLIIYPSRKFEGKNANVGNCTGAFYTWPSPTKDQGHLLLKGIYRVNKTDSTEVTYTIPFKTDNGENSTYLDIAHNHRYIVSIIDADPYQLKCTLTTADWEDDGIIDDYEPDNTLGEMKIDIPEAFPGNKYVADSSLVYMTRGSGSYFNVTVGTNSEIKVTKSYEDGSTDKDWLKIEDPTITENLTKALSSKTYNFKITINGNYDGEDAPKATVTFTDRAQGISRTIYVNRLSSDIKANSMKFAAKANMDTTLKVIAPAGCSASIDWNGGSQWFTLNKTTLDANESEQDIKIIQKPSLHGLVMKPATITFQNNKPENGDRAITITATGFAAPLDGRAKIDTVFAYAALNDQTQAIKFKISNDVYLGCIGTITGDTTKVSISTDFPTDPDLVKKITIKIKDPNYLPATIRIPNASDSTKVSVLTITGVETKKYYGDDVWCYGDVLVAPRDTIQGVDITTAINTGCPEGWQIPSGQQTWIDICGGPQNSGTNIEELQNKQVFTTGTAEYWSTGSALNGYFWTLRVQNGKITAYANSNNAGNLRCVHE